MRLEIYDSNKLNFVELNTTGNSEEYNRCDENSKFIDTEVFNLFAHCFENSNTLYEYFDATRYNSRNIIPLTNELEKKKQKLESLTSKELFVDYISNVFLGSEFLLQLQNSDKNWEMNWKSYLQKLIDINQTLLDITHECVDSERTLWVIGY
jgi:hypothetical protein